ncbi:MAG: hypothetical protein AAF433_14550, partial [Bacteroidota bacterium]
MRTNFTKFSWLVLLLTLSWSGLNAQTNCDLVVDCSNITDEEIACRADLPAVDFDLPIVTDSCGDVIRSALTIIPGNSACPEDTLFIDRTYFLQDQDGNMAECMQIFTVISRNGPTIVCPADGTVNCNFTPPMANAADATATFECTGDVTVTGPELSTDGSAYVYTYTATDNCGRTASCEQLFIITGGLVVDCSNITDEELSCRSDLPAVDFALPVVTDSCGDVIRSALTIIPGNSGCPEDTVFITRTYFQQDTAGNMAECMQTFTVVSDTDPTIVCPADGTVECGETPVVSAANAVTTDQCSNHSGATSVAGPVVVGDPNVAGTTYTYTYTYTDACGRSASCEQVFTVVDDTPPVITCPADVTIECDEDPAPFFEGSGEEGLEVLTFDTPTSWADGETGEVVL